MGLLILVTSLRRPKLLRQGLTYVFFIAPSFEQTIPGHAPPKPRTRDVERRSSNTRLVVLPEQIRCQDQRKAGTQRLGYTAHYVVLTASHKFNTPTQK